MPVSLLPDQSFALGIDIGGTKCAVIVGDSNGKILCRVERATADGLSSWPDAGDTLVQMVSDVCKKKEIKVESIGSIGVSCGGPLRTETGTILNPPNLPGWENVEIKSFLSGIYCLAQVSVENDANATAIAEHRWGAGIGANHLAYLTCGTGIGAGLILDGRIYRGRTDLAGEIGHAVVVPDGRLCLCGKRGCLEALASGSSIGRIGAEQLSIPGMSGKMVLDLAASGNKIAQSIVDTAAYYLGVGIANLLQTLNLERVIIGSLASYAGESYLEAVRQSVIVNTWPSVLESVQIVGSGLGDRTQDLAALAVALPMVHSELIREQ